MSRKGKNTYNTTKRNTTPVKPKDPTTARFEQPNIDEAEENGLQNNFRRMFEALEKDIKTTLKEMKEKSNKKTGRYQKNP